MLLWIYYEAQIVLAGAQLGITMCSLGLGAVAEPAVARIIERLGLTPYTDRRAGTLSLGNAQRLGLAKSLLHEPELLILDEPANGLDPAGIVEISNLLIELAH